MYLRLLNYNQDIRHILSETFDVARQACDRLRSRYSAHVPCRTVEPLQSHWKILNERLIITMLHTALTDITRIERQLRIFQFPGIQVVKRLQSWKKKYVKISLGILESCTPSSLTTSVALLSVTTLPVSPYARSWERPGVPFSFSLTLTRSLFFFRESRWHIVFIYVCLRSRAVFTVNGWLHPND